MAELEVDAIGAVVVTVTENCRRDEKEADAGAIEGLKLLIWLL